MSEVLREAEELVLKRLIRMAQRTRAHIVNEESLTIQEIDEMSDELSALEFIIACLGIEEVKPDSVED